MSNTGRNVGIVDDKEFKSANSELNRLLKQRTATGKCVPTQHKEIITKPDLQNISSFLQITCENPIKFRLCMRYNLSIHFISRGLKFHHQLNKNSFQFEHDEKAMSMYVSRMKLLKHKNNQGGLSKL